MAVHFLSDDDVQILKEVADSVRKGRFNPASRVLTESSFDTGEDHQAPETYIVKPPDDGIPAISGTQPGEATCEIYKIIITGDKPKVVQTKGYPKKVYNVSESDINTPWALATREKFGNWLALVGGAAAKIVFRIVSADPANCQATVRVWGRPCGSDSVEDESDTNQLTVYDPLGCLLNEPAADLKDRWGTAFRGQMEASAPMDCAGVPTGSCIWIVDQLCCPQCEVAAGTASGSSTA